jgi:hypothetical protein
MMDFKSIPTIQNNYSDFYSGNRRSSLEYALHYAPNGEFSQFGVYKGESALWMLTDKCEKLYLYDSFEGLPEDWNSQFTKGHFKCEVPVFGDNRVKIIKGYFEDVIDEFNSIKFGLVHIDCDLYSSTKVVLNNLKTFKGQIIVFDEIYNIAGSDIHELKAFSEWVTEKNIKFESLAKTNYSQLVIRIL